MYSKLEVLHLQCLIITNSSCLRWCGNNCFCSHSLLINLLRSSSLASCAMGRWQSPHWILPMRLCNQARFSSGCWVGTLSLRSLTPYSRDPNSLARLAQPVSSAALQHLSLFPASLPVRKITSNLSSSWKISPEVPHHGQRHGVWNFTW